MGYFTDHSHMYTHVTVIYCSINVSVVVLMLWLSVVVLMLWLSAQPEKIINL